MKGDFIPNEIGVYLLYYGSISSLICALFSIAASEYRYAYPEHY